MKIFIDADGCPVVKETCEIAKKYNIDVDIICDTSHTFNVDGARTITVSKGADSVDFYLVNLISKNDIVITQDYGLAAMCLSKGALAINQNGLVYNDENILSLLNNRHTGKMIRRSGGRLKGPKKREKEMDEKFKINLIEIIERLLYNVDN